MGGMAFVRGHTYDTAAGDGGGGGGMLGATHQIALLHPCAIPRSHNPVAKGRLLHVILTNILLLQKELLSRSVTIRTTERDLPIHSDKRLLATHGVTNSV